MKVGKNATVANTIGKAHLDDQSLYVSSEDNILLMIHAADVFVKNEHKHLFFHVDPSGDTPETSLMTFMFATWRATKVVSELCSDS